MTNKILILFLLTFSLNSFASDKLINIELQDAKLHEVLKMILTSVMKEEYIFSSDLQNLSDPVNISLQSKTKKQVIEIYEHLLMEHDIHQSRVGGVLYLSTNDNQIKPYLQDDLYPQPIPEYQPTELNDLKPPVPTDYYIYQPQHLSNDEVTQFFKLFDIERSYIKNGQLIYRATQEQHDKVQSLLLTIDTPKSQYEIIAATYEVSKQNDKERSIDIIADIFKNLGLSIVTGGAGNVLKYTGTSLTAAFKFFDSDTRFRSISKPRATVKTGEHVRFQSGQDVPILDNITTNNNVTQQSITYRQSGVIMDIQLDSIGDNIDLKINHELSNFVQTKVGVNNSPTLNKQSIDTTVTMHDSEILVIGGLTTQSGTVTTGTALGLIPTQKSSITKDIETFVFLQVNKL